MVVDSSWKELESALNMHSHSEMGYELQGQFLRRRPNITRRETHLYCSICCGSSDTCVTQSLDASLSDSEGARIQRTNENLCSSTLICSGTEASSSILEMMSVRIGFELAPGCDALSSKAME